MWIPSVLNSIHSRVGKFLPVRGKKTFFPWKKPPRQKHFLPANILFAGKNTFFPSKILFPAKILFPVKILFLSFWLTERSLVWQVLLWQVDIEDKKAVFYCSQLATTASLRYAPLRFIQKTSYFVPLLLAGVVMTAFKQYDNLTVVRNAFTKRTMDIYQFQWKLQRW